MTTKKIDIQEGMAAWFAKQEADKAKSRTYDKKRVQFAVYESDITALLQKGYSRRSIWLYLRESNLVTYTYATFCRILNDIGCGKYSLKRQKKTLGVPKASSVGNIPEAPIEAPTAANTATSETTKPKKPVSKPVPTHKPAKSVHHQAPPQNGLDRAFVFDPSPDPSIFERGDD